MGVGISYMGTKKELASSVAGVVAEARSGALLDAFSGMCSVAEEVGTDRQVWTNDVELFSAQVGAALFTSKDEPLGPVRAADLHHDEYLAHQAVLAAPLTTALALERELLDVQAYDQFVPIFASSKAALDPAF